MVKAARYTELGYKFKKNYRKYVKVKWHEIMLQNERNVFLSMINMCRHTIKHCKNDDWFQSHYIEVTQGDIFMEQKMWFGLVLGRLAILKEEMFGPNMSNFYRQFFHVFRGLKNIDFFLKNIVTFALKSCIICLS